MAGAGPLVLFGDPVAERAEETRVAERTLYRRVSRFEAEGMESLFDSEKARRRRLPPAMRRLVVDLKAEHPALNLSEISRVCYAHFGRRPDDRTVRRVLEEEPLPLRMIRRYPPYREILEARERRVAVVALHAEGWTVKAIASYLRINRDTAYVALRRWIEEGEAGLEDRRRGRPDGVRKVDMRAIAAVRKLQENPELGEFRIHAVLAQIGVHLSPRTCGRILALNRRLYGLEKPSGGGVGQKKAMPFASNRRHEFWTADVRYLDAIDEHEIGAGDRDQAMEREIVKAVAGFRNAHGGTLLIGVNDNHETVGIGKDYKLTRKGNRDPRDSFENWLTDLFDTSIGKAALANAGVTFEEVGGHDICRVEVTPSRKPVYALGKQTKDFCVRLNNGTCSLDVEEAFDYISSHNWSGG